VTLNTGYQASRLTPRIAELSRMQADIRSPWDSVRHDYFTFEMALDYLKTAKPRVMYIAFGETDDWAHDKRYDRVAESIQYFDRSLERLFSELEHMEQYRGKTAVVITSDHGRGGKEDDWFKHGRDVEGANRIWAVIAGPDRAKAGELKTQSGVAAAILRMLNMNPEDYLGATQ
jgi:phosphopentomutase